MSELPKCPSCESVPRVGMNDFGIWYTACDESDCQHKPFRFGYTKQQCEDNWRSLVEAVNHERYFKELKMSDKNKGIYKKYEVRRTDGKSDPGEKHENCEYFVLDLNHDSHSIPALKAYADSCEDDYPLLAEDIRSMVGDRQ